MLLGLMMGAMALGRLSDIKGRRPVFHLALFLGSLFGFLSAFAPNFYVFIPLRQAGNRLPAAILTFPQDVDRLWVRRESRRGHSAHVGVFASSPAWKAHVR